MSYPQDYVGKHPGILFSNRVITKCGLKKKDIAVALNISIAYLDDFIKGKRNLWKILAENIEQVYSEQYNIKAKDLIELQKLYDEKIQQTQ